MVSDNPGPSDSLPQESGDTGASTPTLLTLRGVAAALGVDPGQLSKESRRPGFPSHSGLYDPAEVRAWRQVNVRRKKAVLRVDRIEPAKDVDRGSTARPAALPTATPSSVPGSSAADESEDADLIAVLRAPASSALEVSRAAMGIASRRVARNHLSRTLGPHDFDGLKKALQELRNAEADYVRLQESVRQLVPREQVRLIVGECCMRLVQVLGAFENAIALEFAVWLADPRVTAMSAEERARMVRGFVSKGARDVRERAADEIEKMIEGSYDNDPS